MDNILDDILQDLMEENSLRREAASNLIPQVPKITPSDEKKYKEILWKDARDISPNSSNTTPLLPIDRCRLPTDNAKQAARDFLKSKGFSDLQADARIKGTIAQG